MSPFLNILNQRKQRKTTMTIKLLAYKNASESAKTIRDAIGIKMLKKFGSKWKGKEGDVVINWGSSTPFHNMGEAVYLNNPKAVARAANKLTTQMVFDKAALDYILPYTTNIVNARKMIEEGKVVVCRTKLTGNSGEGIIIAEKIEDLVEAKLYTEYKKKTDEYRVHVFDGKVISVQRKARKMDVPKEDVNWKIRNLEGGFIFARTGFDVPRVVTRAAKEAVKALGLDFGAVDIGYHKEEGCFVYEVNTACGLTGSNLYDYTEAFYKKLGLPVPVKPEGYVPPTKPEDGEDGVAPAGEVALDAVPVAPPAPKHEVLTGQQVVEIAERFNGQAIKAILEIKERTGVSIYKAQRMAALAYDEIKGRNKLAAREFKVGDKYIIRPDLKAIKEAGIGEAHIISVDMYRAAGKTVTISNIDDVDLYDVRATIDGDLTQRSWYWKKEWLVPVDPRPIQEAELTVDLGVQNTRFKIGNINKILTIDEQIKVAGFIATL